MSARLVLNVSAFTSVAFLNSVRTENQTKPLFDRQNEHQPQRDAACINNEGYPTCRALHVLRVEMVRYEVCFGTPQVNRSC